MLHQKLPAIDSSRLDGWGRWLAPALALGAGLTVALLLLLYGQASLAAVAIAAGVAGAALAYAKAPAVPSPVQPLVPGPDYSILGSALGLSLDPTALTSSEGAVLIVNTAYRERFGGNAPPLSLAADDEARQGLELARTMAWRDGAGCVAGIATSAGTSPIEVERVGAHGEHLLWRFPQAAIPDPLTSAVKRVALLSNERSRAVKFQIDKGKVEIASSSPEFGEAKEVLIVEYASTPVTICFNAQYVLDFLSVVETDSVGLEFKDEMSQAVMKPIGAEGYDYTYVIMPMRV